MHVFHSLMSFNVASFELVERTKQTKKVEICTVFFANGSSCFSFRLFLLQNHSVRFISDRNKYRPRDMLVLLNIDAISYDRWETDPQRMRQMYAFMGVFVFVSIDASVNSIFDWAVANEMTSIYDRVFYCWRPILHWARSSDFCPILSVFPYL